MNYKYLLNNHTYKDDEKFVKDKVTTINIIMSVMFTVILFFTILRFSQAHYIQASLDLLLVTVIFFGYFLLRKDKKYLVLVSRFLIFFAVVTALSVIIFSPQVETRFSWISLCIYMMFFLLDLKEGIRWVTATLLLILTLFITNIIDISIPDFIIFFVATTILSLLLSRYEKIKYDSQLDFFNRSKELKEAVRVKTLELNSQKEMFEAIFKNSFDGVLLIENEKFIDCNDATVKMLGYENKEEFLDSHPSVLSPKHQYDGELSSEKADRMIRQCMDVGVANFEWIHTRKNGENFWCDVTLTRLMLEDKSIIHTVWRDISDKKELEFENIKIKENLENEVEIRTQELLTAMRTKSDFLANMSHEIRTPLNAILGFITILKKDEVDPQRQKHFSIVESSSESLLTIINDILDFSKIESGKLELEDETFNLYQAFEDIEALFFEKANEKDINLKLASVTEIPSYVSGDIVRLKQVVSNLLSNAIKFTPNNGNIKINISYDTANSTLSCSIIDNGIGISEKNISHIFDSFSQADSSTTRKFGGTGLGLSISKHIIELMNGSINVVSTQNVETIFSFNVKLPTSNTTQLIEHTTKVRDDLKFDTNSRILLVEDNKTNQVLIKILLKPLGLSCDICDNGLDAVNKIEQEEQDYDLILMDENMPVMNGIEATKKIRSLGYTKVPIIAVTANALKGDMEKFLSIGMDDYISKPIDHEVFKNILNKYIGI